MDIDFASVFHGSPVPAMVLDRELRFVNANAAYLESVDRSLKDLSGHYVFDVFPEEESRVTAILDIFHRTLDGERPVMREIPFTILKNGVETERWWTASHAPIQNESGDITHLVQYSEDVTEQVRLRQLKEAVMGEMQHRIGNYFTIVQAIARQTSRSVDTVEDFSGMFAERLDAFYKAQKLLNTEAADDDALESVITRQLAIHAPEALERIQFEGPLVQLTPLETQAISMVIHELSANSLKYGAVRNQDGKVKVGWTVGHDNTVRLIWEECGIEQSETRGEDGYGTLLLKSILPRQLNGTSELQFDGSVFRYVLNIGRGAG